MATIPEALAVAIQHHESGRLQAAEQIYRQILAVQPKNADANHLLGVIAAQVGNREAAAEYIRRAIGLKGNVAAYHNNLGNVLKDQGKLDEAVECYRRALKLKRDYAEAHNNLGATLTEQGKLEEAVECCRRARKLKPEYTEAHNNLGVALKEQGKLDEAAACFRRALKLKPEYAEAHRNLGDALKDHAKLDEAVACYRRALEVKPDYADAHVNLGIALTEGGNLEEAIACWRRALELKPDCVEAYSNLGNALTYVGQPDDAAACLRRAIDLNPAYAMAHNNLGNALKEQGKLDEAIACYRKALDLKADYTEAHSNLLLALQYRTGVTLAELAEAHIEFDRRHATALRGAITPYANAIDRQSQPHLGRLRVGFVSADLGRHPVGTFLVRVLENLDKERVETVCYSDRIVKDDLTLRLQSAATEWRDVKPLSDQRLAERIAADKIDILFDLAGHTGHNRLLVFARKPAPIQITWIGYEGTTGLAAMDYLIADRYVVPEGSEGHCRERVLRMPDGYLCYDPPSAAPPVGPLPALANGYATFSSFNNTAKITAEVVGVWSEILRRTPAARLVLKYRGLGDPSVRRRYLELFAAQGVSPDRLELLPESPYAEYLLAYHQVDVALDPFPFSGSATTCEALWMGLPVVTCPGETFASRHSLSHLANVGLTETIAGSLSDYVERAVSLAGDPARLAVLRLGLRERMAASSLCDGKRFAENLLSLLHEVWQTVGWDQ